MQGGSLCTRTVAHFRQNNHSIEESYTLATDFDLTGGQIDNVVRKFQIQILLSDTIPFIDEIRKFCEDEKGLNSYSSIGYKKLK